MARWRGCLAASTRTASLLPVKYTHLKEGHEGNFGGVGVYINIQDGYLTVLAPMEDTPAYEAGVMSGEFASSRSRARMPATSQCQRR